MPLYDFKCSDCDTVFDVMCKISERESQACPSCGSKNYQAHHIGMAPLGDAVRLGVRSVDNGFREVLSRINSANGRQANLKDKLSRN
jgi:putative FmdB family regulatory protein